MKFLKRLLFLFSSCALCEKPTSNLICDDCLKLIDKLRYPTNYYIDKHKIFDYEIYYYSLFRYEYIIRDIILNYKSGDRRYSSFFSSELKKWFLSLNISLSDVLFIPLPSSLKGLKERGFDQCIEILKKSKLSFIPIVYINKKNKSIQKKLDLKERKTRIKTKFAIKNIKYIERCFSDYKYICFFDDINTTGSSLKTVTEQFLSIYKNNVKDKKIICLTLCKEEDDL